MGKLKVLVRLAAGVVCCQSGTEQLTRIPRGSEPCKVAEAIFSSIELG